MVRYTDRGLGGGVRCQLQRRSDCHSTVRLVVLAGRRRGHHVPNQRYLHGVRVECRPQQGQVVRGGDDS